MSKLTKGLMLLLVLGCSYILSTSAKSCRGPGDKNTVHKCKPSDREGDFCPEYYRAVCGYKPDIRCFTTPCNHITYPNECFACHDPDVVSYTYGECTQND